MTTSASIKEIVSALLCFHKQIGKISKSATNPFFKSKYADLPAILDAISDPLNDNGLVITQFPEGDHGLTTRLLHTSGEWMESTYFMHPVKSAPQDAGSAITYQRRYALGAILSLNIDEDDDGNKASGNVKKTQANGYNRTELETNGLPMIPNKWFKQLCEKIQNEHDLQAYHKGISEFSFDPTQKQLLDQLYKKAKQEKDLQTT